MPSLDLGFLVPCRDPLMVLGHPLQFTTVEFSQYAVVR